MKKLLTFAGVSALALITAAPDAFAAVTGVGIYNPECTPIDAIPVNIYGLASSGASVTKVATGSLSSSGLSISGTELAKIQNITSTTNYPGGLTPRGILFYQSGATTMSAPASSLYTATDSDYIVTETSCGVDGSFNSMTAGDAKTVATTLSFGLPTSGTPTLPSLSGTNVWEYLTTGNNTRQINMLIAYAATCVQGEHATCTLTVKDSGSANYVNICESGSTPNSDDFGGTAIMCIEDVQIGIAKVDQEQSEF